MPKPETELPKRRRTGPAPRDPADLRTHTVSVRLNPAELAQLDRDRAPVRMQRGEYLRAASWGKLPPTIPAINREAWASLARAVGNLNQFQAAINEGRAAGYPAQTIEQLRDQVQQLRSELLGIQAPASPGEAGNEG